MRVAGSRLSISARGLTLAFALVLGHVPAAAASTEAQVKAAYLYKFASFVRWPENATRRSTFRLCVAGRGDIVGALRELVRGQQIEGRPVEIQSVSARQSDRAAGCNVLFFGRGAQTARGLSSATDRYPVLTVGDRNSGTGGGVIDFTVRDGKVRFVVDQDLARTRGLELSSKLLDVALAVDR